MMYVRMSTCFCLNRWDDVCSRETSGFPSVSLSVFASHTHTQGTTRSAKSWLFRFCKVFEKRRRREKEWVREWLCRRLEKRHKIVSCPDSQAGVIVLLTFMSSQSSNGDGDDDFDGFLTSHPGDSFFMFEVRRQKGKKRKWVSENRGVGSATATTSTSRMDDCRASGVVVIVVEVDVWWSQRVRRREEGRKSKMEFGTKHPQGEKVAECVRQEFSVRRVHIYRRVEGDGSRVVGRRRVLHNVNVCMWVCESARLAVYQTLRKREREKEWVLLSSSVLLLSVLRDQETPVPV